MPEKLLPCDGRTTGVCAASRLSIVAGRAKGRRLTEEIWMADTSMPPPKQGGSGAFIGAAIVMLLAMGGLLYWKFGTEEEKPAPEPPPSATAEKQPVFDEPPPPPPPPEPEDAGKEEEEPEKKATKRVARGSSGCSGTCSGGAPASLRQALGAKAGQARGCYERALRNNAMLQGRLVVAVRVSPYGSVCSASIASDSLGDPSVASCVAQKFRGATLPKPEGGCVDVQVPISFKPKTK